MTELPSDSQLAAELLDLATRRGPSKTFCPSEVARALFTEWRGEMDRVRRVAAQLVEDGQLVATQRGAIVKIETARGPIRLGLALD